MMMVLFNTELRPDADAGEYQQAGERMYDLVSRMPGFISAKRYSAADGESFTMVKFESAEALDAWRHHPNTSRCKSAGASSSTSAIGCSSALPCANMNGPILTHGEAPAHSGRSA